MSRVHRASITAAFGYLQFGLTIAVGVLMVPFVLRSVGPTLLGFWLASGEVLAYAAMADLGVLGVLPWMIAKADGSQDRPAIRRLMSTGLCAALIVSAAYVAVVVILWQLAPVVLKLQPEHRAAIAGPLALMAAVTAFVLPLRVAHSALSGLQDVRYCGLVTTASWAVDVVLTVTLLLNGYGLWALAIGASVPSALSAAASVIRLRWIAPDLLRGWPLPSRTAIVELFKEGSGGWLGAWGWRLATATDAVVIASFGDPVGITMLSMTARLGQMLTNMAWVPGDSALVGLAQLGGEGRTERLRAAMGALFRVYLTLGTVAACVVLAANAGFVRGWVGPEQFAGLRVNALLAMVAIAATAAHALAVSVSTLGKRVYVGAVALVAGVVHVALAYTLCSAFGLLGIPLAGALAQGVFFIPVMLPALRTVSGFDLGDVIGRVVRPWALRAVPMLVLAAAAGIVFARVPIWIAIPLGVLVALVALFVCRPLILDYPPVAAMIRSRLAYFRLDGLLLADPPSQPGV